MRKFVYVCLVAAIGFLCGCSEDKPTLYIYNWSDYIEPQLIYAFEEKYNCKVNIDTFEDNESMLAKLLAGGGGYDLIFPSSYTVPVMKRNDLLLDLDLTQISNAVKYLDKKFSMHFHEGTLKYSVPYSFSMTGIAYRKDKIPNGYVVTNSWQLLKSPVFSGRMCMLRDMREVLGMGLKLIGCSINTTVDDEVHEALDIAKGFKKHAAKLDNEQYRTGIVNGEMLICMGYACDILQLQEEDAGTNIAFFIPNEGSTCCWDEMVIPKEARHADLAYKFINFLYDPQIAAANSKYICATVPNTDMWRYMEDKYRLNQLFNVTTNILNKLELIQDVGRDVEIYNQAWDDFTTNRD